MVVRSYLTLSFPWLEECLRLCYRNDKVVWHQLGVPFRTSHDTIGRAVAIYVSCSCQLQDLSLSKFQSINPVFDKEVYDFHLAMCSNLCSTLDAVADAKDGICDAVKCNITK